MSCKRNFLANRAIAWIVSRGKSVALLLFADIAVRIASKIRHAALFGLSRYSLYGRYVDVGLSDVTLECEGSDKEMGCEWAPDRQAG